MIKDAFIDSTRVYRYWLSRTWDEAQPKVCFIMLNPSTADHTQDDPTIRRCIGFAKSWGFGGLVVVNLFALRATDPKELYRHRSPVGPENDKWIQWAHARHQQTICAWGEHGALMRRGLEISASLSDLWALGLTKNGAPRHPLYLRADVERIRLTSQRVE